MQDDPTKFPRDNGGGHELELHILSFLSWEELLLILIQAASKAWLAGAKEIYPKVVSEAKATPNNQKIFTRRLFHLIQSKQIKPIQQWIQFGKERGFDLQEPASGSISIPYSLVTYENVSPLYYAYSTLDNLSILQSLLYKPGFDFYLYSTTENIEISNYSLSLLRLVEASQQYEPIPGSTLSLQKSRDSLTPVIIKHNDDFYFYCRTKNQKWELIHLNPRITAFEAERNQNPPLIRQEEQEEQEEQEDDLLSQLNLLPFKLNQLTHLQNHLPSHLLFKLLYKNNFQTIPDRQSVGVFLGRKRVLSKSCSPYLILDEFDTPERVALFHLARFEAKLMALEPLRVNGNNREELLQHRLALFDLNLASMMSHHMTSTYLNRLTTLSKSPTPIPGVSRLLTREDWETLNSNPQFRNFETRHTIPSFLTRQTEVLYGLLLITTTMCGIVFFPYMFYLLFLLTQPATPIILFTQLSLFTKAALIGGFITPIALYVIQRIQNQKKYDISFEEEKKPELQEAEWSQPSAVLNGGLFFKKMGGGLKQGLEHEVKIEVVEHKDENEANRRNFASSI